MRAFVIVLLATQAHTAFAQRKGDIVVVSAPKAAELKHGTETVATVPRGTHLTVMEVDGASIRVSGNGKDVWVSNQDVIPLADAPDFFTKAIHSNPNAADYCWRGKAQYELGKPQLAIKDFDESIRRNPEFAIAYHSRGIAFKKLGKIDKAIDDYNSAIRIEPNYVPAYGNRAMAWEDMHEYEHAIADYKNVVRIDPRSAKAINNLAWLLATCPKAQLRDGQKAIEYAKRACDLTNWKHPYILGTLAAAYAETGDFDNAVKYQQQADSLYSEKDKQRWKYLIELYKAHRPYEAKPAQTDEATEPSKR